MGIKWGFAMGLILTAVYTDLSAQRVPNELVMLGVISGFYLNMMDCGPWGGLVLLKNMLVIFVLMYMPYITGGIGAGDVKLMMALSAMIGIRATISIIIYSFIVAGAYGLCHLIRERQMIYRMSLITGYLYRCLSEKHLYVYNPIDKEKTIIHFTVCVLCAYMIWMAKEGVM